MCNQTPKYDLDRSYIIPPSHLLQAEEFSKLEQRTRTTLLANLVEELSSKTRDFIGGDPAAAAIQTPSVAMQQRRPSMIMDTVSAR
jgi:hypothetical protein